MYGNPHRYPTVVPKFSAKPEGKLPVVVVVRDGLVLAWSSV
jgi:hypothetical protein